MKVCKTCGQTLPEDTRPKPPPLPPLDFTNLVTIHDLPPEAREHVVVKQVGAGGSLVWKEVDDGEG